MLIFDVSLYHNVKVMFKLGSKQFHKLDFFFLLLFIFYIIKKTFDGILEAYLLKHFSSVLYLLVVICVFTKRPINVLFKDFWQILFPCSRNMYVILILVGRSR